MWQELKVIVNRYYGKTGLGGLQSELERRTRFLRHEMGKPYEDAALLCLQGGVKVPLDDEQGSRQANAFDQKVLHRLEAGIHLDQVDISN